MPTNNSRTDKLWNVHQMEYLTAIRMNKLSYAMPQMNGKESIVYASISIKYKTRLN